MILINSTPMAMKSLDIKIDFDPIKMVRKYMS